MALTAQLIKANSNLATLTDDQIAAIVQLSTNDETTVIGTRIGELHGRYDTDILTVSGIAKNPSEKSYDYVKRVLTEYKTKVDGFSAKEQQIVALTAEKTNLEKQLRDNAGDAAIKQKLVDAEAQLTQLRDKLKTDTEKYTADIAKLESGMLNYKVESQLDLNIAQMKFKSTIPDSVRSVVINNTKAEILNKMKPEFVTIDGKEVLRFRDENGQILNNPANALNPFTPGELLASKLTDIIDTGRKQTGSGSGNNDSSSGGGTLDLSGVKTQIEADELIQKHLLEQGLARTSPDFAVQQQKIRTENNVNKLPMR